MILRGSKLSEEAERVRRLVEFKKKLESRIEQLNSDLKDSQALLDTINSLIIEKGFKRLDATAASAETVTQPPTRVTDEQELNPSSSTPSLEIEKTAQLQTTGGDLLANIYQDEETLHVVMAEDKDFNINTPPFRNFLIERVLSKMQERDETLLRTGQISPENTFYFNLIQEGDVIREITIKNADPDRLRELKSSIRWTLEKMYERMKAQS